METGALPYLLPFALCGASLSQGRYRWCHDKVLLSLANTLERERCKKRLGGTSKETIAFIKEGARPFAVRTLAKSS
ncbi:Signal recognition particle 54 kDa protein [Labeo rohita]|uniref:Signal recognition particle 54 kDa protein n=1 Tax=Labeo rohita TaxID=84645 RepID=A0ABQ8MMI0_LABRO|nr:Signal recognition particle 54 kDa protein [Labeo rohita]